jgi:hypothetical protein
MKCILSSQVNTGNISLDKSPKHCARGIAIKCNILRSDLRKTQPTEPEIPSPPKQMKYPFGVKCKLT